MTGACELVHVQDDYFTLLGTGQHRMCVCIRIEIDGCTYLYFAGCRVSAAAAGSFCRIFIYSRNKNEGTGGDEEDTILLI